MRKILRHYKTSEEGATALEFALILPLFLTLLFGIMEFALIMHVTSLVQNAAYEGARFAITGHNYTELQAADENLTQKDFIDRHIKQRVGMWMREDDQLTIETTVLGNITDLGTSASSGTHSGYGGGGQAVLYTVRYDWDILTPFLAPTLGDDGVFPITAIVASQNEEF